MKLYATTSSERASKGQGGNDFLFLQVKNENEDPILTIAFEIKGLKKPRIAKVFGEYETLCDLKAQTLQGIDVEIYSKANKQKTV